MYHNIMAPWMVFISEKEGQMHIKPTDDNTAAQFVARFWLRETKVSGLYSSHALILNSSNHDSGPESKLSSLNDTPQCIIAFSTQLQRELGSEILPVVFRSVCEDNPLKAAQEDCTLKVFLLSWTSPSRTSAQNKTNKKRHMFLSAHSKLPMEYN